MVIARAAELIGIQDRFLLAFFFRLAAGIISLSSLFLLLLSFPRLGIPDSLRKTAAWFLCLLFFTPYLMVRPSSEMMSAAFLTAALSLLFLGQKKSETSASEHPAFNNFFVVLAGLLMGFAFVFRYQTGAVAFGAGLWLLFRSAGGLKNFFVYSFFLIPPILLGFLIDRWGYGEWTFTPWNYFYENLIKGVAATMGTKPFFSYLYLSAQGPMAPVIFLVMLGTFLFWLRFPGHLFTWSAVPFFLLHSFIAHKEPRFMYPLAWVAAMSFFLFLISSENSHPEKVRSGFFLKANDTLKKWGAWLWSLRGSWFAKTFYGLNVIGLVVFLLSPARTEIQMQKVIYKNLPSGAVLHTRGPDPYENKGVGGMFFYRPQGLVMKKVSNDAELFSLLKANPSSPIYYLDAGAFPQGASDEEKKMLSRATVIFQTFPKWIEKFNFFNWLDRTVHWHFYRFDPD